MDYLIVEEFNRFWALFAVNERLYPHRRACTLNLWMKMPQEKRSAIIEELCPKRNGVLLSRNWSATDRRPTATPISSFRTTAVHVRRHSLLMSITSCMGRRRSETDGK